MNQTEARRPAPPLKRRVGGRSARVRADVLAATVAVLAERGYVRLSFDDVAARAGVHKTTLYRRWASKADLVLDALHARSDMIIELPDTGRLHADLMVLVRSVARNVTSPIGRALLLATMYTGDEDAEALAVRHRFWNERFDRVAGARLETAKHDGELAPDIDTGLLVETLVSPIYFRALIRSEPLDDSFLRSLVRQVLASASPRPELPTPTPSTPRRRHAT